MKSLLIAIAVVAVVFAGRYLYMKPKFMMGSSVPNFETNLKDNRPFQLEALYKDNIVLLDFWGSWCGPCRADNPKLVKLYDEFHGQSFDGFDDFEIVSVAIETRKESWERAIQQDDLKWEYHIGQFDRFSSPIAKQYGVREIPTTYLINTNGKIIGVNMTYDEIKSFLSQKLSNK